MIRQTHLQATCQLTPQEINQEIMTTQDLNRQTNTATIFCLESKDYTHSKVTKLLNLSHKTPYPSVFMLAALRTQKAANRWDHLFKKTPVTKSITNHYPSVSSHMTTP